VARSDLQIMSETTTVLKKDSVSEKK